MFVAGTPHRAMLSGSLVRTDSRTRHPPIARVAGRIDDGLAVEI
jgi:hypothetical protein